MHTDNWVLVDTGPDGGVARASGENSYERLVKVAKRLAQREGFDPEQHTIGIYLVPEEGELFDASTLKASRVKEWASAAAKRRAKPAPPA